MTEPDADALACVRAAALSRAPISIGPRRTASPHEFYRYPARFSPDLAASIIQAFTEPGDLVADYFVGGGTTLVEARRAGRLSVGSDINSLSVFVSKVKTRLYSKQELDQVRQWSDRLSEGNIRQVSLDDAVLSYFRNVDDDDLVPQRDVFLNAVAELAAIDSRKARDLARCIILRTAQWALDMRREVPSAEQVTQALADDASRMVSVARTATAEYRAADKAAGGLGLARSLVLHQGLPGVSSHAGVTQYPAPRLVLTSPPYPGVYVNYHRWKVRGRRETPFPYYLAGQEDGNGLAYYTMSARSDRSQRTYFAYLEEAFCDIAEMCDRTTRLVQIVGFNNVGDHLARYLLAMQQAGFAEVKLSALATASDGRLWRDVPGRRWWANAGGRSEIAPHTAHEVVLIHGLA